MAENNEARESIVDLDDLLFYAAEGCEDEDISEGLEKPNITPRPGILLGSATAAWVAMHVEGNEDKVYFAVTALEDLQTQVGYMARSVESWGAARAEDKRLEAEQKEDEDEESA